MFVFKSQTKKFGFVIYVSLSYKSETHIIKYGIQSIYKCDLCINLQISIKSSDFLFPVFINLHLNKSKPCPVLIVQASHILIILSTIYTFK